MTNRVLREILALKFHHRFDVELGLLPLNALQLGDVLGIDHCAAYHAVDLRLVKVGIFYHSRNIDLGLSWEVRLRNILLYVIC